MKTVDSKQQAARFGAYPKKIMCQCNAEELAGEVMTIEMNSRCPVCDSLRYIAVPKPAVAAIQPPKKQVSVGSIERREEQVKLKERVQQTPRFGANPKKIMCQCNEEEMKGNMITIPMNSRCPACNSLRYVAVPKPAVTAVQQPKPQASVVSIAGYMERRMQLARELNAHIKYQPSDWVSGVLAL